MNAFIQQAELRSATERFINEEFDPFYQPDERFPTLERYWSEPAFRAELEAEQAERRAQINAQMDAVRDRDLRRLGYIA